MILANEPSRSSKETASPSTGSKNGVLGEDEILLELNPVSLMLGAFSMMEEDQQETNDLQQGAHKRSNVNKEVSHHTDGTEDNTDSSHDSTSFLFPSEHEKKKDLPDSPATTTTATTLTASLTPPSASCSEGRKHSWRWVTDESNGETKLAPHIMQKLGIESLDHEHEHSAAPCANDDNDNQHEESSTSGSLVALEVTRNFVDSLETSNNIAGDGAPKMRTSQEEGSDSNSSSSSEDDGGGDGIPKEILLVRNVLFRDEEASNSAITELDESWGGASTGSRGRTQSEEYEVVSV